MLRTVLICLACVGGVASVVYPAQQPSRDAYQQSYGSQAQAQGDYSGFVDNNDLHNEIRRLSGEIAVAYQNDDRIAKRLVELIDEDVLNTALTDRFLDKQFPELRMRQANQSEEISEMEREAERMSLLADDVVVLTSTLAEIQRQYQQLANESARLQREAYNLVQSDAEREKRLAAVSYRLAEQEQKLRELEVVTAGFRENLERNMELVGNLTTVIDQDQGEQVVYTLTEENPSHRQVLEVDFRGVSPVVQYGFSAIHIIDESQSFVLPNPNNYGSYGGKGSARYESTYNNASISFTTDVVYISETNELVMTMLDHSTGGWAIFQITVTAAIINIDNKKFQVEVYEESTNATTNAPTDATTYAPTYAPTDAPSYSPSDAPSYAPTDAPSYAPSDAPSDAPTYAGTYAPTDAPTYAPSDAPTYAGTYAPTDAPTYAPTYLPTETTTTGPYAE